MGKQQQKSVEKLDKHSEEQKDNPLASSLWQWRDVNAEQNGVRTKCVFTMYKCYKQSPFSFFKVCVCPRLFKYLICLRVNGVGECHTLVYL